MVEQSLFEEANMLGSVLFAAAGRGAADDAN